jgi:hypothetical protein
LPTAIKPEDYHYHHCNHDQNDKSTTFFNHKWLMA